MKYKSLIFYLFIGNFLYPPNFGFAQGILNPEWVIKRSSPVNLQTAQAWGVDTDENGFIYWAASIYMPGQAFDILLYKLDPDSNEVWPAPTIYSGPLAQQAYIVTVSGNIAYVGGRYCRNAGVLPLICDMLVFAVDIATGDTLWSTTLTRGFGYEEVDGLVPQPDGIYLTGWSFGETTESDLGLLKLDMNGDTLWTNHWGSDRVDHQDGHCVVDDSVIYVAGLYSGDVSTNPLLYGLNGRALLAKFSRADGTLLDSVTFATSGSVFNLNFENALGMTGDSDYLYVVGVTTFPPNDWQVFINKYDKNLNLIWERFWGGSASESARSIALGGDGSIYVAGSTESFGQGEQDVMLLKYSSDGDLLWYKTWGDTLTDHPLDLHINGDDLYISGQGDCFQFLTTPVCKAFLVKIDLSAITGLEGEETPAPLRFALEQNYPNPFNPKTTISFSIPRFSHVTLKIYDLLGREVETLVSESLPAGAYRKEWNGEGFASGVYLYRLSAGEHAETKRLILIR